MSWLLRHNWLWSLIAFLLGAGITWLLLDRRRPPVAPAPAAQPVEKKQEVLVGAAPPRPPAEHAVPTEQTRPVEHARPVEQARRVEEAGPVEEARPAEVRRVEEAGRVEEVRRGEDVRRVEEVRSEPARTVFSQPMEAEPTLFDVEAATTQARSDAPPGRYGEGSADAVPHQGPPDGFTIKGNAQSMLFHTPDSPYYGRTKPEVWFRTEADAERAGFSKYTRRPRKSANPND